MLWALGKGFAEGRPRKAHTANFRPAQTSLSSAFCRALGKGIAESSARHSAKKSGRDGGLSVNGYFAECPSTWHSANFFKKFFTECPSSWLMAIFLKKILPSALPAGPHQRKNLF
jgi:hypothetical protein